MAHQTDIHVVHQEFKSPGPPEMVVDPVCGMELERQASKHVVFRAENPIYFCSRECRDRFLDPKRRDKAA